MRYSASLPVSCANLPAIKPLHVPPSQGYGWGQETSTWHSRLCHARIRDGQSEDARVSRFDVEKMSDLGIEYDIVSKLVGAVQRMNMNDKAYKASLGPSWRGESSNAQLQLSSFKKVEQ